MTLPAAEQRGIVVLQGMDIMRVHTPGKQLVAGSKSPQRGGVWTRLRIKFKSGCFKMYRFKTTRIETITTGGFL
jgi:hypothetical protein